VLHMMHQELISRSIGAATELNASPLFIRGDRVQLQQVLINLIQNAADSMSQSSQQHRMLSLRSARLEGNVIEICLSDTGPGIRRGDEEKIFDSYYTTKPGGLGLGLSLSRSILRAHGGQLRAETHDPSGATFRCTLPEWRGGCANGESLDSNATSMAGPNTARLHSHVSSDFPAAARDSPTSE
jgi:C4-dicarboxylate-specific signal transduction histidine kinase